MQDMTLLSLLQPWFFLLVLALLIGATERWIHRHFFGVTYLLTKDAAKATRSFYVFFLPGIVLHEVIQYLVAGLLDAPLQKKSFALPEPQADGTLRLDFIVVDEEATDRVRLALVSAAPFLVMGGLLYLISSQILDLHLVTEALGSGDVRRISAALGGVLAKPDAIIWLYALFAIANAMIPTPQDMRGLPVIGLAFAVLLAALLLVGMGQVVLETLAGPLAAGLADLNTALLGVFVLNVGAIFLLGLFEDALERWRGEKMDYSGQGELTESRDAPKKKGREPGSDAPLEAGSLLPSLYNLTLPLPKPADVKAGKAKPAEASSTPPPAPAFERPAPSTASAPFTPSFRRTDPSPDEEG